MMNDILSDQHQIVLQDLCKNFIPCFLEKFNNVLTQNPASPFSRRIQIDELKNRMLMSRVFQVKPKRLKRSNGTVLTPEMVVTVTTMQHTATPFYNGAKEVQEAYMRLYAFDYKKACCNPNDFEFIKLD